MRHFYIQSGLVVPIKQGLHLEPTEINNKKRQKSLPLEGCCKYPGSASARTTKNVHFCIFAVRKLTTGTDAKKWVWHAK